MTLLTLKSLKWDLNLKKDPAPPRVTASAQTHGLYLIGTCVPAPVSLHRVANRPISTSTLQQVAADVQMEDTEWARSFFLRL